MSQSCIQSKSTDQGRRNRREPSAARSGGPTVKHIIAAGLTAACATTGAWAQSSVTLYGSLDAGIAYISNAGGHSKWIMEQGNMQPDRWGLKGVEDLGGGLKCVFQLEI